MRSGEHRGGRDLTRYAWISLAAALVTIALKVAAYGITGSVGLLSDALESSVNVMAAVVALAMLRLAARPPDETHQFGHGKAEYFASGFEGALILVAAAGIAWAAWQRLLEPQPVEMAAIGLLIVGGATLINLAVARLLFRAGARHDSIALEANARHLMTDVWTSVGIIVGVGIAALTGWARLDALIALAVAAHIVIAGFLLLRRSALGLLDTALPPSELEAIEKVLVPYRARGIGFHAVRTRKAGGRRFVSLHVLVPGGWSVQRGHELLEEIEAALRAALPQCIVFTHLEPLEDPASFADSRLERTAPDGG